MENYTAKIKLLHCEMEKIFTSSHIASPCGAVLSTAFQLHNEQLLKDYATLYLTRSTMQPTLLLSNLIYVLPSGAEFYSETVMCAHLGVIGECKVEIQNFMNQVII